MLRTNTGIVHCRHSARDNVQTCGTVIETSQRIGGDNDAVTTAAAVQQCEGHEHFDIPVVDELISMTVDDLFNRIFNDATFYAEFTRRRHTTGMY